LNLRVMLEEAVRRYKEKTAIISGNDRLSYAEVDAVSNKIANYLLKLGVSKGDRVAMLLSSSLEFVTVFLGIIKIGAIAVPLDTKCKLDEYASLLDNCRPGILVAESNFLEVLMPVSTRFSYIQNVITVGNGGDGQFVDYQQIIDTTHAGHIGVKVDSRDIALISYTGGPASRPRGTLITHENLIIEGLASGYGFEQTEKDVVVLFALPLFHAFGLEIALITSLFQGSTVVIVPGLSLHGLMQTIEREGVTIFMGVPYIFTLAVNMAEVEGIKHNLSSLRLCVSGGASLSLRVIERFRQYYGLNIAQVYGLTEATAHVTCQPADGSGKPGGVGGALAVWDVKVVDDDGRELSANETGEIIVRGQVMAGYYNNPEDTAETMAGDWLLTGDFGWIDEDGEVFIQGLKKDMILVKGQNAWPMDIETVLRTHPGVAEAAVVGIADELRGERIRAVVRLKDGCLVAEKELQEFCREHLANFKVPKQVVFTDSIPRTAKGQFDKQALKNM